MRGFFPRGMFGSGRMPAAIDFVTRYRPNAGGGLEVVAPIGVPPAGVNQRSPDRFHLASRNGARNAVQDEYTQRPLETYQGGFPTTKPPALFGGVKATNVAPNPKPYALGRFNVAQEYGGATIYDGKLPPMNFVRAMPYARIPPKLPGLSTAPARLAASGFVDPHEIASRQLKAPVGGGLRYTP